MRSSGVGRRAGRAGVGAWRAGRLHAGRLRGAAVLVLVGAVAGTGVARCCAPPGPRLVLRDHLEPPPDLRDYPSPLAGFRSYVKDHRDETGAHRRGAARRRPGAPGRPRRLRRHRVGRLGRRPPPATFRRIGERIEPDLPDRARPAAGDGGGVRRRVGAHGGPALRRRLRRPPGSRASFYVNRATGTGLADGGPAPGGHATSCSPPRCASPPTPSSRARPLADVALPAARYPEVAGTAAARMLRRRPHPARADPRARVGPAAGLLLPRPRGRHAVAARPRRRAASTRCSGARRWSATRSSTPPPWRSCSARSAIPSRVVVGFAPPAGAAGHGRAHRRRRHRLGGGAVRGARLGAVLPHPGRGPDLAAGVPDAAEPAAAAGAPAPAAGAGAAGRPAVGPSGGRDRRRSRRTTAPGRRRCSSPPGVLGGLLVLVSPLLLVLALKVRRRARRRGTRHPLPAGGRRVGRARRRRRGPRRGGAPRRDAPRGRRELAGALAVPPDLAAGTADLATRADAGTFAPAEPDDEAVRGLLARRRDDARRPGPGRGPAPVVARPGLASARCAGAVRAPARQPAATSLPPSKALRPRRSGAGTPHPGRRPAARPDRGTFPSVVARQRGDGEMSPCAGGDNGQVAQVGMRAVTPRAPARGSVARRGSDGPPGECPSTAVVTSPAGGATCPPPSGVRLRCAGSPAKARVAIVVRRSVVGRPPRGRSRPDTRPFAPHGRR